MSFYFEISNLKEEGQFEKICDKIDELEIKLRKLEENKDD
jgi:uncharacterized protein YdcH (DUF465 family)